MACKAVKLAQQNITLQMAKSRSTRGAHNNYYYYAQANVNPKLLT